MFGTHIRLQRFAIDIGTQGRIGGGAGGSTGEPARNEGLNERRNPICAKNKLYLRLEQPKH